MSKKETTSSSSMDFLPPVVAVLGHVDHGKTTLLDTIRKTHVAQRETGGITQGIGAYKIEFKGKNITFIDTPGHAAFSKMRQLGGQASDIVILVVAADDGVMPQTLESIRYIQEAGVPYIVAVNKIDLPGADIERVKKQLSQNGVLLENYGGDVVAQPISAKSGQGVDDLLDMILLIAEMNEIGGDPEGALAGVVIESKKDKAGSLATIVVKNGTLKVGDQISAGENNCKVKGLLDELGKKLSEIGPGEAAEVLGFTSPPAVGSEIVKAGVLEKGTSSQFVQSSKISEEDEKKYKIFLRADTTGSMGALLGSLPPEAVVVGQGVGEVTESDVISSQGLGAKIYTFRVKVPSSVSKLATSEKVEIKSYDLIYKFLEDLEKDIYAKAEKEEDKILARAEIVAEFFIEGKRVAGGRVLEGVLRLSQSVRLKRNEKVVGEAKISSLQYRARSVKEVKAKEEFGVFFDPLLDFKVGDVLISYASFNE
ncbi:MAG: GTP-binding protein [bacterium]|nr:GTP-binding protein [bacterium]